MSENPFGHIEGEEPPPQRPGEGADKVNPFTHLEIGEKRPLQAPRPPAAAGILCPQCHQANEKERQTCWSCSRPLYPAKGEPPPQAEAQEICLVLDGIPYKSTDAVLPPDVKDLFGRIGARGYSTELMEEWRQSRRGGRQAAAPLPTVGSGAIHADLKREGLDIEVLEGRRCSFIRIEEKTYTSDDPAVPPELRWFFDYLKVNGVTPDLMAKLRQYGRSLKTRPDA